MFNLQPKDFLTSFINCYYALPLLKVRGSVLYPPFKKLRLSVRPSVRQRIVFTLLGEFLTNFLQTCFES